ncbi:Nnf1-domain-containing protein [Aulographum hederae CBS 113979]|uniref:Nnf1-domain-containing protein n=1 Tax=Aulographum hederae CBS 113979 TaxID=1176131 RepID=A0A6G1HG13_9PEZI|nr:Nnf1-domain-containing protein [Aulographum hederae CBS 113979]
MPAATTTSRSPSPPDAPPIALAPGPRATALSNAFNGALAATLKRISYDNFASCFPTPAKYRPETMDAFWRDFTGRLEGVCKSQFESLIEDRSVVAGLNELDRLVAEAGKRRDTAKESGAELPVPPHTLPPSELHHAHLHPFLNAQQEHLQGELSATQASNAKIIDNVSRQRSEMEALVRGLEEVVKDLEASAAMLGAEEVSALVDDIKAMDTEMKNQ